MLLLVCGSICWSLGPAISTMSVPGMSLAYECFHESASVTLGLWTLPWVCGFCHGSVGTVVGLWVLLWVCGYCPGFTRGITYLFGELSYVVV